MKKFNKLQQKIIREEFARAAMILKAKKTLNEHQFNFFINELRDYENNLILTESNQNELMYEGLKKRLNEDVRAWERIKNFLSAQLKSLAPDDQEKLEDLANRIEIELGTSKGMDEEGYAAMAAAKRAKVGSLLAQMAEINQQAAQEVAKAYSIPFGGGGSESKGGEDPPDAADLAKDPKAKAAADKIEDQADAAADRLESPKAKSIFDVIVDAYKYAFAANTKMWKNVFGFFTKTEKQPAQLQDRSMVQLLAMLFKMMQQQNVPGEPTKPPSPETVKVDPTPGPDVPGKEETEEAEPVDTIASVQRPIINVIQRVATAQGVKIDVSDAQEIAIAITKNLADQMRANGVVFKGDKPKEKKAEEPKMVAEDIKRQFEKLAKLEILRLIKEERVTYKHKINQKEKMSAQAKGDDEGLGLDRRYKHGAHEPSNYISSFEEVEQKFSDMGLWDEDAHYEYRDSENDDNFVDYIDLMLDIEELKKTNKGTRTGSNEEELEVIVPAFKKLDKMLRRYKNYSGYDTYAKGPKDEKAKGKERKRRYRDLKKKAKKAKYGGDKERIKGEKARGEDKIDTKDMSMAGAEKGKVNISRTVSKAIQAGGLDQDVAKKLTPILKKKIRGIIAKHMGDDVRYLEEKINRYVQAVIREVK